MHTIKPLDQKSLKQVFKSKKLIVTVEEHTIVGGLGSSVLEFKNSIGSNTPQLILGLNDNFGKTAEYNHLLKLHGLTGKPIAQKLKDTSRKFRNPRHYEIKYLANFTSKEADAVKKILLSNKVNYLFGDEGKKFEDNFSKFCNVKHSLAVANGTLALDLCLRSIQINQGDEVIVTGRTFIASASSISILGGTQFLLMSIQTHKI